MSDHAKRRLAIDDAQPHEPDLQWEIELMSDDIWVGTRPAHRRFVQLVDAVEAVHARYAICGAVALGAHGCERFTNDLDVLVDGADLERVVAALSRSMRVLGRTPAEGSAYQIKLRSKRAKTYRGVDIDLLVPVDVVEAWALATAVRARYQDRKIDVISPEALVVMKLGAFLSDVAGYRGGQHRADAMRLLATTKVDIDMLRRFVKDHPDLAAELERVLAAPPPRGRIPET
jgi:hypothetical protein